MNFLHFWMVEFSRLPAILLQPGESPMVFEKHEYFERKDPVEDALSLFGEALTDICQGKKMYT